MQSRGNNKKIQMSKYMVYIVLAVVFVFFAITLRDNGFASTQNLLNILRQTAMISIMSVAGVFVLSAGQIDLTVGSNTAMSAMLVALVLKSTNNIFLALIVALIFGVAVGVINGLLVTRLGLPAFLATLGMMQVIRGAAMWITNTEAVPISNTVFNTIFGTGFEMYEFGKAIVEGYQPSTNFGVGYRLDRVCDAILESNETGSWVKVK